MSNLQQQFNSKLEEVSPNQASEIMNRKLDKDYVKLVRVKSDADSRGIKVRIVVPKPDSLRYKGAPVVVYILGGCGSNGLGMSGVGLNEKGFIEIFFNFPEDVDSGYDYRGPRSLAALRDVVRFALGEQKTLGGQTLAKITAGVVHPLYRNVGILGMSNGGNAALTVAGKYGNELNGLAWILNYESPVGDGMPVVDAGSRQYYERGMNPKHNQAYDPDTGSWSLEALRYDGNLDISDYIVGFDELLFGGFYFDFNHERNFIVSPFYRLLHDDKVKVFYSERIINAAETRGIFPAPEECPDHLATSDECRQFWSIRNGEKWLAQIRENHPNLMFMVTAHEEDHAQTALDHPHVLIQYQGMLDAGARFVRLNPDRSYVLGIHSDDPEAPELDLRIVDNPAFRKFDHSTIRRALQPNYEDDKVDNYFRNLTMKAGCCELADRTQLNYIGSQIEYPNRHGLKTANLR